MRWGGSLCAIALFGVGCGEPLPAATGFCAVDQDCASDEDCVSGICEPRGAIVLDAGVFAADAGPSDAGAGDASAPDAADAGAVDAGAATDAALIEDAGAPDTGAPDSGAPDTGAPDSGTPDSGTSPDAGPPLDAGPVARGIYTYRRMLVTGLTSNRHLTRAVVTPDDATLVVSGRYTDLFVIDRASETLRGTQALPSAGSGRVQRIEVLRFDPSAGDMIVAATVLEAGEIVEGRLYRLAVSGTSAPTPLGSALVGVAPQAITADPVTGALFVVGHRAVNGAYWVTVHSLDPSTGATALLGQSFTSAGCQDGAVVADGLGGRGVAYACGINGGEVGIRDSTGVFTRGPNTGNTAHIEARPQGDYAVAVTWSGGRLARFEQGVWTLGFNAPSVTNAAWNVAFSDDGARALVVGQYSGTVATVFEYRHDLFTAAELSNVSIPGFDAAPYLARSGVILEDAAWRPGADCGYLVGGCESTTCTRGYLVDFRVSNGRSCP